MSTALEVATAFFFHGRYKCETHVFNVQRLSRQSSYKSKGGPLSSAKNLKPQEIPGVTNQELRKQNAIPPPSTNLKSKHRKVNQDNQR